MSKITEALQDKDNNKAYAAVCGCRRGRFLQTSGFSAGPAVR